MNPKTTFPWQKAKSCVLRALFLLTVVVLQSQIIFAQDGLNAKAHFDTTSTTARVLLDRLKTLESVRLSYNENAFNLDNELVLPAKDLTVIELLEILSEKLNMEYQFHGKQIILKQKETPAASKQASVTVSGYVKDQDTGEALIGATVQIKNTGTGTVTNLYGFYSLTIPQGSYTLVFSYVGYDAVERDIVITRNETLSIELREMVEQLSEITITGTRPDDNVALNRMSFNKIDAKKIQQVPALFGEADPIRVVKLLPGVSMTGEMSSSYSVRGGGYDQNLILLDEATVYNPSHLMGIFSTFNNDAIKGMEFYKGNLPARYGGRLSSLLDVRMKEGNNKRFSGQGGVSPIASRLTLEVPTIKDRGSLIVSGRRTYADIFTAFSTNDDVKSAIMYFYDFNAKTNLDINDNNKIYVSTYLGRDNFGVDTESFSPGIGWGNFTTTFRWNHLYNSKLFSNLSLIYSKYDYKFEFGFEDFALDWRARLDDYTFKLDYDYFLNAQHTINFGLSSTLHVFNPGKMVLTSSTISGSVESLNSRALEHGIYLGSESKFMDNRLLVSPGLRLSLFQNLGAYTLYHFDENSEVTDTTQYGNGDLFNTFVNLEPRLAITYRVNPGLSIKSGFSRSIQYLHLASNSIGGTPLDVWVPSTPNVRPQRSDQYSIGLFQNLFDNQIETSVEFYYKNMSSQIDFRDHANLLLNPKLEGEFRFGKAHARGVELMVSKPNGKVNGWISYTYSRSKRKIEGVNNGNEYRSPYDRPHNLSVVANYQLSKRIEISGNWVWFTGSPFTVPAGKYYYNDNFVPVYTERNGDRLPDYQRLDLSITLKGKQREDRRFHSSWNLSVYNVLNRKNPSFVNFEQSEANPDNTQAVMYYVLPILPSIAWIFSF